MDLDTEETRETHNLYIESTYESLKNIKDKNILKNKASNVHFKNILMAIMTLDLRYALL